MATARALLVALLLVVSVTFSYGALNPEADADCQGGMFPKCNKELKPPTANCATNKSEAVMCVEEAFTRLKQKDCNDQQRKGAKRLVDLYKYSDWFLCNNTEFWAGMNETEKKTCWETMKGFVFDEVFGYGALPCRLNKFTENRAMDFIEKACKSKNHQKYFYAILKEGDCVVNGAYDISRTNAVVVATMSFLVLLLAVIL